MPKLPMKPPPGFGRGGLVPKTPVVAAPAPAPVPVKHPFNEVIEDYISLGHGYLDASQKIIKIFSTLSPERLDAEKIEIFKFFQDNSVMKINFSVRVSTTMVRNIILSTISRS